MATLRFNQLEIFCLLQALKVIETKDNVEREKLSNVFKQLKLLEYNSNFAKEPNRPLADFAGDETEFEVADYVPQFIVDATEKVSVKGPFELSMAMLEVTTKAKASVPPTPEEKK